MGFIDVILAVINVSLSQEHWVHFTDWINNKKCNLLKPKTEYLLVVD